MSIRPAISAPLPWIVSLAGKLYGKKRQGPGNRRSIFRLPRMLSFTRDGKWFLGVLFFIGLSAINTGNNLLYLVVATMLSLIIVSGVISESSIKGIKAVRTFPREIYRGKQAIVRFTVTNEKKVLPSFSFNVASRNDTAIPSDPVYFLRLGPGETSVRTSIHTFSRRGKITIDGVKVSTRFPFGLFLKGKYEKDRAEVTVLPSVKVRKKTTVILRGGPGGDLVGGVKGDGTEIYGLRDITEGDDARLIHWKSAAKASKLLVKEFEQEKVRKVFVVFKNYSADDPEVFEEAVDEAAAAANAFMEKGWSVGLKTLTSEVRPGRGHAHLMRILEDLAVIVPAGKKGTPRVRVES